jgi:hypothetical protein
MNKADPVPPTESPDRILDPMDRISEVLFGLIMVLTFTCTLGVATASDIQVRTMLLAALGCNLAWGIIDAGMYLMARFTERARGLLTLKAIRQTHDASQADRLIGEALPFGISTRIGGADFERVRGWLREVPEPAGYATVSREDAIGALGVFLIVFLSTFPVVIPFLVMRDAARAVRTSHAVAILMLFGVGWSIATHTGRSGWRFGLVMVLVGTALAAMTMALGG